VRIQVRVHIPAPVERVFDAVSDHETFFRFGDTTTKVVQPGTSERNGLGCLREVRAGRRTRYLEEITAWSRPSSFDYLIRETTVPMRHHGGRFTFTPKDGGTEVEWTSDFDITIPLVGRLVGAWSVRRYSKEFTNLLLRTKAHLSGPPPK
jgi:uncharacterized protein YndB with AHSA1/START domain